LEGLVVSDFGAGFGIGFDAFFAAIFNYLKLYFNRTKKN
jgi:hypothetical protein